MSVWLPAPSEIAKAFFDVEFSRWMMHLWATLRVALMGFALSIQISALSWILITQYGLDIHDVGLVWAAGPLAGIIGQVLIGVISDRVWFWGGRRRPFILIGGTLAALMLLALPHLDVISAAMGIEGILGVAIAVALTLDLAINVSFNPTRSIIADVTTEGDERTKGYTWMQTISGTFGVAAYAVGALWNNYVLIYGGAIVVLAFSILPPLLITEPRELEQAAESESQDDGEGSLLGMLLAIRPLWGFLVYDVYAMGRRILGIEPSAGLDPTDAAALTEVSAACRHLIRSAGIPAALHDEIMRAYDAIGLLPA